jgi:hypothetical protein
MGVQERIRHVSMVGCVARVQVCTRRPGFHSLTQPALLCTHPAAFPHEGQLAEIQSSSCVRLRFAAKVGGCVRAPRLPLSLEGSTSC